MAEGNNNVKKYGIPLYSVEWVPHSITVKEDTDASESESPSLSRHIILAGGGGEGSSGIPNALLISIYNAHSNSLSNQPVAKHVTGSDLPYRIAVHPGGEGIICSFPSSCRWFEWVTSADIPTLSLKSSEKDGFSQLEDIGQQLALAFNNKGNLLAIGGEDGRLRVFKWPAMEITLDKANAHSTVKDLAFSPDGKFLVSVGSGPAGRIWDISASSSVDLPKENGEFFGYCRFSHTDEVLFLTTKRDKGGSIVKWNTNTWKRINSTHIVKDQICALNVSLDGKLLAVGTNEGGVLLINSVTMKRHSIVRKAHMVIVTSLAFSDDSKTLGSASLDGSVRVTLIKDAESHGMSLWIIIFMIILAVVLGMYYAKTS